MKKLFSILAACAAISLAACGDRAYAADVTVKAMQPGNTPMVVSFVDARWVNLTPGAQYITSENGSQQSMSIAAADVTALLQSPTFQARFVLVSGNLYINPSRSVQSICSNGTSIIGWATGASEYVNDNCAAFNAIYAASK